MEPLETVRSLLSGFAGLVFIAWMAVSGVWIGPEIASRILTVDHLTACRASVTEARVELGRDRAKDLAAMIFDLPRGVIDLIPLDRIPPELGRKVDQVLDDLWLVPKPRLQVSEVDPCRCAVAVAIDRDRLHWAIFTASAGMVRNGPLRELGSVLPPLAAAAPCAHRTRGDDP